jgi:prevent-host-death family protein
LYFTAFLSIIILEGVDEMSNIRPVSDLRNYNDVLNACREDSPVYLTKKGRGKYVLMDIEDYERIKATMKLMAHIEEGEKTAREESWFSLEDIESALGL